MIKKRIFLLIVLSFLIGIHSPVSATGDLQITCEPNVRIYLNGKFKRETTSEENGMFIEGLAPRQYTIRAVKQGFKPFTKIVRVQNGRTFEVKIAFTTPAAQNKDLKPVHQKEDMGDQNVGTLVLRSVPLYADIYLDGQQIGKSDIEVSNVLAGWHIIKFVFKGNTLEGPYRITPNQTLSLKAHFKKRIIIRDTGQKKKKRQAVNTLPESFREKKWRLFTNSIGMTFVYLPPGTFLMGSPPDEYGRDTDEAQRRVKLQAGLYLQITEATQRQWKAVMGSNPSYFSRQRGDYPVESVSWNEVQAFILRLNDREETKRYRLPTEAEWEYACRAGTKTPFSYGRCLSTRQANFDGNYPMFGCPKMTSRPGTLPVASLAPNAWGLFDMHGNVWEWCQTGGNQSSFRDIPGLDAPTWESFHVGRGGSWGLDARYCRSANRCWYLADAKLLNLGCRLAFTAE